MLLLLSAASCTRPASAQEATGGIRGIVRDVDLGGTVPSAMVQIVERGARRPTDDEGVFFFEDVPAGSYTIIVTKAGYERAIRPGIAVAPGRMTEIEVELRAEVTELEEMVVRDVEIRDTATEEGLLRIRETSVSMQDAISGDLLRRAGASDAAAALRMVVGASIEDGRYATVRGLSDRYVGAALNGIRVPSADPKRRAVHMDLFPAGTIRSLSVAKTFTPDLPGDYSGGGVNIETLGVADRPFVRLSFSREYDPEVTSRQDFLGYDRPPMDRWGRHRGARALPVEADNMEAQRLTGIMASYHDRYAGPGAPHDPQYLTLDRITRAFTPVIGTRRMRAGPNWGAAISLGDRGDIGDGHWGWQTALNYGRKYSMQRGFDRALVLAAIGSGEVPDEDYTREVGAEELKFSQMAAIGITDGAEDGVTLTALRNRVTADRAALRREVIDFEKEGQLSVSQGLHYTERSLDVLQFRGRHTIVSPKDALFGLKTDWYAARHITRQEEPDVRFFRNVVTRTADERWMHTAVAPGLSASPQDRSTRIWRDTQEENTQLGMNVELPFERWVADPQGRFWGKDAERNQGEGRAKFGLSRDWTIRDYSQQSYYYQFANQQLPTYTGPIYSVPPYPRGAAGRRRFEADVAAWRASPAGQLYQQMEQQFKIDSEKSAFFSDSPDALWSDVFLKPDRIGLGPCQNSLLWYIHPRYNDISYHGEQEFHAGYAMIEFPVTRQFSFMIGARAENTRLRVDPRSDMDEFIPLQAYLVPVLNEVVTADGRTTYYYTIEGVPRERAVAEIRDSRWLPAASMTYEIFPGMKLRGAWSRTIARPTFLEIAPIITYDFIENETVIGNRDLVLSSITNYDLRLEYLRGDSEVYGISWFRKQIADPIEKESFGYLTEDYLLTVNYPSGSLNGIEAEFRRRLDFLPWPGRHLMLKLNYTRIESEVVVPENMRISLAYHGIDRETRPMEGQPKYLFNAGLLADFESSGTSFGLFYNLRGDTLKSGAAVGEKGARPDIYTLRQGTLNLTLSQKIGRYFTVGLRLSNLTEESAVEVYRVSGRPDVLRRTAPAGVLTSFNVSASF